MRFRDRIARFMYGRYGGDQLGIFIIILNVIVIIVSWFFRQTAGYYVCLCISAALLTLYIFRAFSRKRDKRARENAVFMKIITKIKEFFVRQFNRIRYIKKYRYRKCKNCKTFLRLPRKRGKHTVRCPKCGSSFNVNILM